MTVTQQLQRLSKSKFRRSQRLSRKLLTYAKKQGIDTLEKHTRDLLSKRLFVAYPFKDGKQTPYKGHPVFLAQHGTATCCRSCLSKWYDIPKGKPISAADQEMIISLIRGWLCKRIN